MSEDIKIYHVETQEDYYDLMIKLENEGYTWFSGKNPTDLNTWVGEETVIYLDYFGNYTMSYGLMSTLIEYNPNANIIKHKVEGARQMEKVVVPQFVATWFEQNKGGLTIYGLLHLFSDNYFLYDGFRKWAEDYDLKEEDAQEIIAKMYLFQDYEIEVEEEKKYYWRKKKECLCDFEEQDYMYLNVHKGTGTLAFGNAIEISISRTLFTETEVRKLVSEEDFNKLEKVEIADDEC